MATAKTLAIRNIGTTKVTVRNKITGKDEERLKPGYKVGIPITWPSRPKAPSRRDRHRLEVAQRKEIR
jgi:hypothetical protein